MSVSKASLIGVLRYTGIAGAVLAWAVIMRSASANPWFIFTRHAFSDLGGPRAVEPWVYNYGLIATAALMLVYSLFLVRDAVNKLEAVGGAFAFIAALFLALVGVYPSGTRPHEFVSIWFFAQADMAVAAWGIGLTLRRWKALGAAFTTIGLLGPLLATLIEWPSVAVVEAYGIILIDAWVVLMLKVHAARRLN